MALPSHARVPQLARCAALRASAVAGLAAAEAAGGALAQRAAQLREAAGAPVGGALPWACVPL